MYTTVSLIINIDGPSDAKWSIKYFNQNRILIADNLVSGQQVDDLSVHSCYMLYFTDEENYKNPGPLIIELDSEVLVNTLTYVYKKITLENDSKYKYSSTLKTKKIEKPVVTLNQVNLDLTVKTKEYYKKLKQTAFLSRHHFESNSQYYNITSSGKVHLFLKNFRDINEKIKYMRNINYYTVPENEVNRLDLISWYFYRTPELMWVIMSINNITDPFNVPAGTVLKILPRDFIEIELLRKEEVV